MSTKTRRELIDRAGEALGVLAAGQTLSNEDYTRIDGYIDPTADDLIARDVYYVADTSEIDGAIFDDFALCVANACRHAFGLSGNPELPAAAQAAEAKLRIKSASGPTYKPLRSTYF